MSTILSNRVQKVKPSATMAVFVSEKPYLGSVILYPLPFKIHWKANNNRVAVLLVENNGEIEVSLNSTDYADALNSELSDINFMLGFELPGDATNFRVISDNRNNVQVDATAVFVSEKPYLYFSKILERRDEAEIVFKGTQQLCIEFHHYQWL